MSTALVAFTGSYGKGLREMLRDALTAAVELWPVVAPREDARPEPQCRHGEPEARCASCAACAACDGGCGVCPYAARPEPEAVVLPERFPRVRGRCPACGRTSLMLASDGYVTCASLSCRDPEAASNMLERRPEPVAAPLPTEGRTRHTVRSLLDLKPGDYVDHPVIGGWAVVRNWQDQYEAECRLVQADDTDTVRVPREAVEMLREEVAQWSYLDDNSVVAKLWDPLESTCRHASLSIL